MAKKIFTINKFTAAGCQLDSAIELYFRDRDEVSCCVLIHSAWSNLKDLLKIKKIESSRDWMPELFLEEEKTKVWKKVDEFWTYCKHASDDSDKNFQFPLGYSEAPLFLAIYDLSQLTTSSEYMDLYQLWFIAKHKTTFEGHGDFTQAFDLFPDIENSTDAQQKNMGLQELLKIDITAKA